MNKQFILLLASYLFLGLILYLSNQGSNIAVFQTSLKGRTTGQKQNITLGAQLLNGATIKPGEVFSFLNSIPVIKEKGFEKAPAIVAGKVQNETGGGICQLSSTLYNAALRGDLQIVERHPHLFPPLSVPPGFDATVAQGSYDLQIKNPYSWPVTIYSNVTNDNLLVKLEARGLNKLFNNKPKSTVVFTSKEWKIGADKIAVEVWKTVPLFTGQETRELVSRDSYWQQ